MSNFSFDIVSEVNKSEVNNVFDQVKREISSRYDFKNTIAGIEWLNDNKNGFKVIGSSEMQIDAIIDIIRKKLSTRSLSQKLIDTSKEIESSNMKFSKELPFANGIDKDKAKDLSNKLRALFPKLKIAIIGESLRVSSVSKNELQNAINKVREMDLDYPVQFNNFR